MEQLASFEKVKELGSQKVRKFNDVYLVRHKLTGEFGVLKHVIKTAKNEHLVELLRSESEFSFDFKGLPKTIVFAENKLDMVLIRNYQPGIPLNEFWKQVPKSERLKTIQTIILKLVPIFNYLSNNSIVHCDIKPSNILIYKMENEIEVSLIDFGMAIDLQSIKPRKTLFALGYSAPELILNKLHLLNSSTDIFALGITFWQFLTGKLALVHENPGIMTNLQITHPLPSDKRIPSDVMELLKKMCVKHAFRLPPNLLSQEEVDESLVAAMAKRYKNLKELNDDISKLNLKTNSTFSWRKLFDFQN